jgi:hypothetical protein
LPLCYYGPVGPKLDYAEGVPTKASRRPSERTQLTLRARLTWKDTSGAVRFASVVTRDISDSGAFVFPECPFVIPLYRLVHLQLERDVRAAAGVPERLRGGRVLSAVWRVGPCRRASGTPDGYALRFLVDPRQAGGGRSAVTRIAVAS